MAAVTAPPGDFSSEGPNIFPKQPVDKRWDSYTLFRTGPKCDVKSNLNLKIELPKQEGSRFYQLNKIRLEVRTKITDLKDQKLKPGEVIVLSNSLGKETPPFLLLLLLLLFFFFWFFLNQHPSSYLYLFSFLGHTLFKHLSMYINGQPFGTDPDNYFRIAHMRTMLGGKTKFVG